MKNNYYKKHMSVSMQENDVIHCLRPNLVNDLFIEKVAI